MSKLKIASIALSICLLLFGCSSNSSVNTTPSGYVITPGAKHEVTASNVTFSYVVTEKSHNLETLNEQARQIVFDWWGNSSTFKEAAGIIPVKIYGDKAPRAFQADGYIFIDPEQKDALVTLIHEYIHIQNPNGLVFEDGTGYETMEMFVEMTAITLAGESAYIGIPTNNYIFLSSCPKLLICYETFKQGFKQELPASEAYAPVYGENAKLILTLLDNYENLPNCFHSETALESFLSDVLGITKEELYGIYENLN